MLNFADAVEITRRESRQSDLAHISWARPITVRPGSRLIPTSRGVVQLCYPDLLSLSFEVAAGILASTRPTLRDPSAVANQLG